MPKNVKGNGQPIPKVEVNLDVSPQQGIDLFKTLQARFQENAARHKGIEWSQVQAKLEAYPEKLASLYAMDSTGGEPDVIGFAPATGE